jgi:iron uptake system component EfeO
MLVVSIGVLLAACGGGGNGGSGPRTGLPVDVSLTEYSVSLGRSSVPAGSTVFDVSNRGPDKEHEFVLVKTDLAPDKLPTKPDGTVDEMGQGIEILGEIEPFAPGETKDKSFELVAGKYVMFCNILDTSSAPAKAHYQLGMRAGFSVS